MILNYIVYSLDASPYEFEHRIDDAWAIFCDGPESLAPGFEKPIQAAGPHPVSLTPPNGDAAWRAAASGLHWLQMTCGPEQICLPPHMATRFRKFMDENVTRPGLTMPAALNLFCLFEGEDIRVCVPSRYKGTTFPFWEVDDKAWEDERALQVPPPNEELPWLLVDTKPQVHWRKLVGICKGLSHEEMKNDKR